MGWVVLSVFKWIDWLNWDMGSRYFLALLNFRFGICSNLENA